MNFLILLFWSAAVLAQSSASSPEPKTQAGTNFADKKSQNQDLNASVPSSGNQEGALEILSDTKGVDFGPYLKRVLGDVRENWHHLIPECAEMMKGKLAIEFAISKDGHVANMRLVSSAGAVELDRPAWGSITASNPFPPLPSEFTGQALALRLRFSYNPGSSGTGSSGHGCSSFAKVGLADSRTNGRSGVSVIVTAPLSGDRDVSLGGSKRVTAMVTGSGSQESTVEWRISGLGCSGTSCGEVTNDSYHAPTVMPSTSVVTLTAIAKADPSAKASITLRIVDSGSSH